MSTINELKIKFEKLNKNKEELKLKIQKIFTNIRTILNEREDMLLSEVDNKFNDLFFNINFIRDIEKLTNKIHIELDKGRKTDNKWNDENKLSEIINNCNNIENNIKDINLLSTNLKKMNLNNNKTEIKFKPEVDLMYNFITSIKSFGTVYINKINNINSLILKNNDDYINFNELI